jgi:plasmid maintenance system killer protein
MSYEDFEKFYKDEIDGKLNRKEAIKAKKQANEEDEEEEKGEEEDEVHEEQKHMDNAEAEGEGHEGEGDRGKEAAQEKQRLEMLKAVEDKKKIEENIQNEIEHKNHEREEFYASLINRKYNLDQKYYREVYEKLQVTTFDNNYSLCVHPEPPMQDVLILFQYDPDCVQDHVISFKDFGLTDRLECTEIPEDMEAFIELQEGKIEIPRSSLNSTEIDITNPITGMEWKLWYDIVVATKGHGFLQILPVGYKSSYAFSKNMMHIIPKKVRDWGYSTVALDNMISIREEYYKKENKRLFDENQKRKEHESKQTKDPINEAMYKEQEEKQKLEDIKNEHIYRFSKQSIFCLPEYDFPHFVCILDAKPSDNSLVTDYMKISDELGLENLRKLGITILINEKWMFVTLLSQPYMQLENGVDLFIDPFAYGGILNIHTKNLAWPQTAGIDVNHEILSYLPSKAYSEPLKSQLEEEEKTMEEDDEENGEKDDEGEDENGEGEDDKDEE